MRPRTSCAPALLLPAGLSLPMACVKRSTPVLHAMHCHRGCSAACRRGVCKHEYTRACQMQAGAQPAAQPRQRAGRTRVMGCAGAGSVGYLMGVPSAATRSTWAARTRTSSRPSCSGARAARRLPMAARRACFLRALVPLAERGPTLGTCLQPVFLWHTAYGCG